jgi:hypothetical protein
VYVDRVTHPILYNIVVSYEQFYFSFCAVNCNFRSAQIFRNEIFKDPATRDPINANLFGLEFFHLHEPSIRSLTYADCHTVLGFKTLQEFRYSGLPLQLASWMRLRGCLLQYRPPQSLGTNISIEDFVARWKKGGKTIRRILNTKFINDNKYCESQTFQTFTRLAGIRPMEDYDLNIWASVWNIYSLNSDLKSFLFDLRNNSLPLNNRLNAYQPDVNPGCSFCQYADENPLPRDSMVHCFLLCKFVSPLLDELLLLINIERDDDNLQQLYWYGCTDANSRNSFKTCAYILIFDIFKYIVFRHRRRKTVPSADTFFDEFFSQLKWTCKFNKKIKCSFQCTFNGTMLLRAIG